MTLSKQYVVTSHQQRGQPRCRGKACSSSENKHWSIVRFINAPKLHLAYETHPSGGLWDNSDHPKILNVRQNLDTRASLLFTSTKKAAPHPGGFELASLGSAARRLGHWATAAGYFYCCVQGWGTHVGELSKESAGLVTSDGTFCGVIRPPLLNFILFTHPNGHMP